MKISKKDSKKILILLAVIALIIILFFFYNKSKDNKISADNKTKNAISTEELKKEALKKEELEKNNEKTSTGDSKVATGKEADKVASTDAKVIAQQKKDEIAIATSSEESLAVFVKAANFGTTAEIVIDSSKFSSSYKYYQFFLGSKPISGIESITKGETSMFPAQKAGSEVVLNLISENKKVLKKLTVKLKVKK